MVCNSDMDFDTLTVAKQNHVVMITAIGVDIPIAEGCDNGIPQGFTKIQSYFPWINKVAGLPLPSC